MSAYASPMGPEEDAQVRAIFARCHPDRPAPGPWHFFVHPTLCIRVKGRAVAFTSFGMMNVRQADGRELLGIYGNDVCVLPEHRGQGLGRELCEARVAIAREAGADVFVGITDADNGPMRRILTALGCSEQPEEAGRIIYTLALREAAYVA